MLFFPVLSLDGGGAKGFYTLGVVAEIEAMLGQPLHTRFDLIFGTSTGPSSRKDLPLTERQNRRCHSRLLQLQGRIDQQVL